MKKDSQEELFEKYPKLFRQKDLDMSQTCMCWGINTGEGWWRLLDKICSWVNFHTIENKHLYPQIEFTQVKEKFGTLSLYFNTISKDEKISIWKRIKKAYECLRYGYSRNDNMRDYFSGKLAGAIEFAESLSDEICEQCGKEGKLQSINEWWVTLCDQCKKERNKEEVQQEANNIIEAKDK